MSNRENNQIKPFLKWAGGKYSLAKQLETYLPNHIRKSKEIDYYFEPFFGGGGLFCYLHNNNYVIKKAYINDINKDLVLTYYVVKNDVDLLIGELVRLRDKFLNKNQNERKEYYSNIRSKFNKQLSNFDYDHYGHNHVKRAAYFIFLNKTCFNGLFRVNSKGEFNVPMGRYDNPKIFNEENLKNFSTILQNTDIHCGDYSYCEDLIEKGSVVYLDPPYRPLSKTSSFTSYSKEKFDDDEQIRLSMFCNRINNKDIYLLLSNSNPKNVNREDRFFDEYYSNFKHEEIYASRSINSNASKRGKISELLITNIDEGFSMNYKEDIEKALAEVKFIEEPNTPFPQADNFKRIICIGEHLLEKNLSSEDIIELNNFSNRQKDYYINAGIYLSLFEKINENHRVCYRLTDRGRNIFKMKDYYRNLELCNCLFEHTVFHHVFSVYLVQNSISMEDVVEIMYEHDININSPQVYRRRGKTVLSWILWVIELYTE